MGYDDVLLFLAVIWLSVWLIWWVMKPATAEYLRYRRYKKEAKHRG